MAWDPGSLDLVGVVTADRQIPPAVEAVAGLDTCVGDPATVLDADPDVVVALGESAAIDLAGEGCATPVLPVDAGAGLRAVPRDSVAAALGAIRDGDATVDHHDVLSVSTPDGPLGRGLFDVVAVTRDPGHISEYAVATDGEAVDRFRGDGVVVATPAGTPGYARRVGCPVIPSGPSVVAIAPIAAFATDSDHWVVPADGVEIAVTRDDAAVELHVDGRTAETLRVDEPVAVSVTDSLPVLRVPAGRSPFARGGP